FPHEDAARDRTDGEDAQEVEPRQIEPDEIESQEVESEPTTAPQEATQQEDDAFSRLAELTDTDLARTYTNVMTAMGREQQPERAEYLGRLWDAVVGEALRRPTFTEDATTEAASLRLAPRRQRRQALFAELRAACVRLG